MRKLIILAITALLSMAVAATALANGEPSHDEKKSEKKESDRGGHVCRPFELIGTLEDVQARQLVVAVRKGHPKVLRGTEVTLGIGSRTRVKGTPEVGATVAAHGTVCQLDEADAPAYFTRQVAVKRQKSEDEHKTTKKAFEVVGVVAEVGDGWLTLGVDDDKTIKVLLLAETEVKGTLETGARVVVAGVVFTSGETKKHVALLVVVKESATTDDDEEESEE